jgi:hydrogenase nickel incorporation protein HypB
MSFQRVPVVEKIMNANDQLAMLNRERLNAAGVCMLNLMASPGAGKTTLILKTIAAIDADKVMAAGIPAVQINTGGECHLDAMMISNALDQLPLQDLDLLIVENVGNLICPAAFNLGAHINGLIASIPEGDDKPYKYPNIYRGLNVLLVSKIDLLPYIDFRMAYFTQGVEILNPGLVSFPLSAKTGEGMPAWIDWIKAQVTGIQRPT